MKRLLVKSRNKFDNVMEKLKEPLYKNYDTSIMTWDWWQKNIKNSSSYLDAVCKKCGYNSKKSIVDSISRGKSFGCWCNGNGCINTKSGYDRWMNMLKEPTYKNLDMTMVTLEYWKKNIKKSTSIIPVKCKKCDFPVTLSLNTIQQNKTRGCLCSNEEGQRVKNLYKKKEGYNFIMKKLKESQYKNYDTSIMTWEWWKKNIKRGHSNLLVKCLVCENICKTTSIKTLLGGGNFGCFCKGGGRWDTQIGYQRIMEKLKEDKFKNYDTSIMTWKWWQENIKGNRSYLNVSCKECGFTSNTTDISHLLSDRSFRCFCNGGVEFKSEEGYNYIMEILKESQYKNYDTSIMTWKWWQDNITGCGSYLDATCKVCKYHSTRTVVSIISSPSNHDVSSARHVSFGCLCKNGGVSKWKTKYGYERIMEILKSPRYKKYDVSIMTWAWWQENVNGTHDSYFDVMCKECNVRCITTSISCIINGQCEFGCSCRYKTQAIVQKLWVEYCIYNKYNPTLNCGNISIDETRMRFDHKANYKENVIIGETDGDKRSGNWVGHFVEGPTRINDIKKQERLFNINYGLWRVYQPWIWENRYNSQYLKDILYKMWDKCEPKTLIIMNIHKTLYDIHINHWEKLGGNIIFIDDITSGGCYTF